MLRIQQELTLELNLRISIGNRPRNSRCLDFIFRGCCFCRARLDMASRSERCYRARSDMASRSIALAVVGIVSREQKTTIAITITIIPSITVTVIHQLLTHLLTSSFSFFLFMIITLVTAIEHLDSRGGLRALERRRACDGVFVMGTCAQ